MAAKKVRYDIDRQFIDSHDSYEIIEPVFWAVSIYDGPDKYAADLSRFSVHQRLVLACHWYSSEINNGGHDQFYSNSTGIVWRDALAGFTAIGQTELAGILAESAERMGGAPSLDREERNIDMESRQPRFDDLDRKFYRLDGESDIEQSLIDYVKAHANAFYFSGVVSIP